MYVVWLQSCENLKRSPTYRSTENSVSSSANPMVLIGCHIKTVMDASEQVCPCTFQSGSLRLCLQICKHIEEHQYLEAGLVFLRAKASFTEIQNSEKEGTDLFAQYPFLHHRWVRALCLFFVFVFFLGFFLQKIVNVQ
jgi:hypothetical protein